LIAASLWSCFEVIMWNGVSAARRTLRKPTRGDDFGQRLRWLAPGRLLLGKADIAGAHRQVQRFGQAQHEITARRRAVSTKLVWRTEAPARQR